MRVIRVGKCKRDGRCCMNPDDGNPKFKVNGICKFLEIHQGYTVCKIFEDYYNLSRQELEQKYGREAIAYFEINCKDFPQIEQFGFWEETSNRKHADGAENALKRALERFRKFKEKTGCAFDFKIIE